MHNIQRIYFNLQLDLYLRNKILLKKKVLGFIEAWILNQNYLITSQLT